MNRSFLDSNTLETVDQFWLCAGQRQEMPNATAAVHHGGQREQFEKGWVRITSGPKGTELKWHAQTPCMASLFTAFEYIKAAAGPFVLRFYVSGWFEEFHARPELAICRINDILSRCDRHFAVRTFLDEVEPSRHVLAPLLVDILENRQAPEDYAVECSYQESLGKFVVEHVGEKSPIARFYGTYTTSPPCTVTSYGEKVSMAYRDVLATGKPSVHHVLAAFRLPDNQVHWVPYHRLVLPIPAVKNRVHVVSQIAPVGFKVI